MIMGRRTSHHSSTRWGLWTRGPAADRIMPVTATGISVVPDITVAATENAVEGDTVIATGHSPS